MKHLTLLVCMVWLSACAPAPVPHETERSLTPGNAALGLRYAEQTCSECHAVARGQTLSPAPEAPTFDVVANTPGMTRFALNAWLHTPHPSMPNLIIAPERIDDLAAYLATLKRE
jgi:mono/diheme cytochrome c family protein